MRVLWSITSAELWVEFSEENLSWLRVAGLVDKESSEFGRRRKVRKPRKSGSQQDNEDTSDTQGDAQEREDEPEEEHDDDDDDDGEP